MGAKCLACRRGALPSIEVLSVSARDLLVYMPVVAGRAASGINAAHLRRIVAGFSRLLSGVPTRDSGSAPQIPVLYAIGGFPPLRQALPEDRDAQMEAAASTIRHELGTAGLRSPLRAAFVTDLKSAGRKAVGVQVPLPPSVRMTAVQGSLENRADLGWQARWSRPGHEKDHLRPE